MRRKSRRELKKTHPTILYNNYKEYDDYFESIDVKIESTNKIDDNQLTYSNNIQDVDQVLDNLRNTCPFCEKRFKDEAKVEKHVRAVHKRPYKCDMCRRSYFTARVLEEHRKTHSSDFYFECSICHLKYKREEGLKQHHIRVHSETEAKFMCDHCGKRYKLKLDLLLHIGRTHMCNIQICRFCGKAVKDVKGHEWRHQKRSRKTNMDFPCNLCFKKFRSKTKLDNHLLMHKERYTCQECGLELTGPSQLMNHKLKHKPGMTCRVCKKVFISRSNFYQHVLTHAGIRPYKCDVCNEDFTQRSSLLRHRKNHPGPLPPLLTPTPIADLARNVLQKL